MRGVAGSRPAGRGGPGPGGWRGPAGAAVPARGRLPRPEDAVRVMGEPEPGTEPVDGISQLNTRLPLVGKVPPWRQPPKAGNPDAPRPFGWIAEVPLGAAAGAALPVSGGGAGV